MQISDVMTRNVATIQANDPVRRAAQELRRHDVGALPVFEAGHLAGIVTDRDLACGCLSASHDPATCTVRQHMMADAITIGLDASVEDALSLMAQEQVRRLVVTNGQDVDGIVSLGDIAVHYPSGAEVGRALAAICQPAGRPVPR